MKLAQWLGRRRALDQDFQDEISSHLAMAARDRVADGEGPEAARLAALREFGNVTLTREATRQQWGGRWREHVVDLWREVAYAVRLLMRSPAFALVVVAVLAIGIGANAAVFLMIKGIFLKPLPGVQDAADLAVVVGRTAGGRTTGVSYPDYRYLRERVEGFSGLAASAMEAFSLGLGTRGERVWGEAVSGNYFQVLGVGASLGRTLLPSDEVAPGQHPVAVITDGLWRRSFGSDPDIVGKKILINAHPLTVVGVTTPVFHGTLVSLEMELFVPLMMQEQLSPTGGRLFERDGIAASRFLAVHGRPRPKTSLSSLRAQTAVLAARLAAEHPERDGQQRALVLPLSQSPFGAQTYMLPVVTLLGVMGALLLIIVCANVANLVLVRGVTRRGEIAVRQALGASRGRIMRLLLVENLVVALPGALGGLLLARPTLSAMASAGAASAPMRVSYDLSTDWLTIGFAILLACGSVVLFGFVPALRSSRLDLAATMKDELSPRGAPRGRLRAALVVSQVAVSLLLLVSAGLVMRSLGAARRADVGFDAVDVVSAAVDLQPNGYDEARGRTFYQQMLDTARADSGTDAASLAAFLPMTLVDGPNRTFAIE